MSVEIRSRIFQNYLANSVSKFISIALSVLVIPLYANYLGLESYGLIGLSGTLQAVISILDLGLGVSITRLISKLRLDNSNSDTLGNQIHAIKVTYWLSALVIATFFIFCSNTLSGLWINSKNFENLSNLQTCLTLMGISIATRWPFNFYHNVLLAFEQQIKINFLISIVEIAKIGGSLVLIILFKSNLIIFFSWQIFCNLFLTLSSAFMAESSLPRGKLKWKSFTKLWSTSRSVYVMSAFGTICLQGDRIILSKLVALDQLGWYLIASSLSQIPYVISLPLQAAIMPRSMLFFSAGDSKSLKNLTISGTEWMCIISIPITSFLCIWSYEILELWTQNPQIAEAANRTLTILMLSASINSIYVCSLNMLIVLDKTLLIAFLYLLSLSLGIPSTVFLSKFIGAEAGAWYILFVNAVMLFGTVIRTKNVHLKQIIFSECFMRLFKIFLVSWTASLVSRVFFAAFCKNTTVFLQIFILVCLGLLIQALVFISNERSRYFLKSSNLGLLSR
jgi:O-antigen/teichoic acid export membrane protein